MTLPSSIQTIQLWGNMLLVWLRAWARTCRSWLLPPKPTGPQWSIRTVLAFGKHGLFKDITHDFDPATWEEDIEQITGWPVEKVEVRYVFTSAFSKTSKYRMVLRPGDSCPFPPPSDPGLHSARRGIGIVSAFLEPDPVIADAKSVNVTNRLRKYAGPDKDFHAHWGLKVRCADILPVDDWDFVTQRFKKLSVIDMHFRGHVFDLEENSQIILETPSHEGGHNDDGKKEA